MLEFLKAIIFGIVEGITEWLPISSTGHMILLNEFLKLDVSEEFWNMFLVVIQLGAILKRAGGNMRKALRKLDLKEHITTPEHAFPYVCLGAEKFCGV